MSQQSSLRVLFVSLFLVGVTCLQAQIVNIERQRIKTDTTGWFGQLNFNFAGSKTTKSVIAFGGGTLLEFKPARKKNPGYNRDLWLFLTEFSLVSGNNEKFSNTGFGHLRFSRKLGKDNSKLSKGIRWEGFAQVQYNDLTKLGTRVLLGTGPRFKLTDSEAAKFYFGIAYMYEYQELIDPDLILKEHRGSSYFSFTLLPEEGVSFTSTTYFQPVFNNFDDYRFNNETSLSLQITDRFALGVSFSYNFNSTPPEDVPNSTYYFRNRLEYSF